MLLPAQAQFWDWGGRPQRQQQRDNNPFGGLFGASRAGTARAGTVAASATGTVQTDFSRAPGPSQKKPEATTPIVVLGDANADWLAYGLEDAFSEKPEIGIVRKHRTDSGLIRYDGRAATSSGRRSAREIIAADKPKFIVMMIGNNDRQTIREKVPPAASGPPRRRRMRRRRNRGNRRSRRPAGARRAAGTAGRCRAAARRSTPAASSRRPDARAGARRRPTAVGIPHREVGARLYQAHRRDHRRAQERRRSGDLGRLPSQRGAKASADSSYLNELYRSRAEKAGITYVDIWDGFVDEAGRYSPQGPDYEGQTRRLRTGDGIYFTKFGARKLAHYVEREIQRHHRQPRRAGRACRRRRCRRRRRRTPSRAAGAAAARPGRWCR